MSFSPKNVVLSSLAAAGMMVSLVNPAVAAPAKAPLPELPTNVVRSSTTGTAEPATSVAAAIMKHGSDAVSPEKINDWNCKPSAEHPKPVVLLHGMFMTAYTAWSDFGPKLADAGYCVFAPNMPKSDDTISKVIKPFGYEFSGLGKIGESTVFAAAFINEVKKATGAQQIDIVGYSEGGTIANLMLHTYDSTMIDKVVSIGGINTGINPFGLQDKNAIFKDNKPTTIGKIMNWVSPAVAEMMKGSEIINKATEGGDTVPGVNYLNISSELDEFVVMSTTNPNFQQGPQVQNVNLQDGCKKDKSTHLTMTYNARVFAMMLNFLAGAEATKVPCLVALPFMHTFGEE